MFKGIGINQSGDTLMGANNLNQKLIIPLLNVECQKPLRINITEDEFVERLTYYMLPEPVQVFPKIEKKPSNKPIPIPFPIPKTTIHFYPWNGLEGDRHEINSVMPVGQLPHGFDVFDNLGAVAIRSGPGSPSSFQTITQLETRQQAKTLLIIEFDQVYPNDIPQMGQNLYESSLTESLLDSVRLVSGNEPHHYKGFHLQDNQLTDIIIKWPLVEFQGSPVRLVDIDTMRLKDIFLMIWKIRSGYRDSKSCKILTTALEYYYLSSTMTEIRTIFLYLMIAFEALFKKREGDSTSAASSRIANLLANTKHESNVIKRFLWSGGSTSGCCQVRNQIVHGESSAPTWEMFWKLRYILQHAILRISELILSSHIHREQYYESLNVYINNRFAQFPDK